jgi:hypothetical protein
LHFHLSRFDVLGRQFSRRLSVQVDALRLSRQGAQVGGAGGVALQEQGEGLAREGARRALLDVGLDAQLQRLGGAAE